MHEHCPRSDTYPHIRASGGPPFGLAVKTRKMHENSWQVIDIERLFRKSLTWVEWVETLGRGRP